MKKPEASSQKLEVRGGGLSLPGAPKWPALTLREVELPGRVEVREGDVRMMKRPLGWLVFGLMMSVAGVGFAQTMPSGHPPVGEAAKAMKGEMPPGHPPMGGGMPGAMGGMGGSMEGMKANGKLSVALVAGTKGAAIPPGAEVTVELFHRGVAVKKIEVKTDGSGKAEVGEIPVMPPVQALVSVNHAGLLQQVVSPELSPNAPEQAIEMKLFEATAEKPAWHVAMQHMIVQWAQDGKGVHVIEMISANTPGDRAWVGEKAGEGLVTMSIPLPAGATDIELGGSFEEKSTKLVDGKLVTGGALFPGRSEYRIAYNVPVKDGAVDLDIGGPATVGHLMVFVPADGAEVKATGLEGGHVTKMGDGNVRVYKASNLAPGTLARLAITGIVPMAGEGHEHGEVAKASGFTAKNIALGGAFLMVLVAAGMMLMKKPVAKKA